MGLEPDTLTFDRASPVTVAAFWAAALGYEMDPTSNDEEGAFIGDATGRAKGMFFQQVPEPKTAKNRVHLDVRPTGSMQEEVDRLVAIGASVRGVIEHPDSFWTQMRDVEGNEFCVLRGPGDGWTPGEL